MVAVLGTLQVGERLLLPFSYTHSFGKSPLQSQPSEGSWPLVLGLSVKPPHPCSWAELGMPRGAAGRRYQGYRGALVLTHLNAPRVAV